MLMKSDIVARLNPTIIFFSLNRTKEEVIQILIDSIILHIIRLASFNLDINGKNQD
jgi:hypothetical protein